MIPSSNDASVVMSNVVPVDAAVTIEPQTTDILCGRGGLAMHNPGNVTYRRLVQWNKLEYRNSTNGQKNIISRSIVATLREQNRRFISLDEEGIWNDIGNTKAIEKTSQALRELHSNTRQNLTAPLDLAIETLPLAPVAHDQSRIDNPHPLPLDFVSGDLRNNHVIFSRVSFDEAENQALREVKTQKREILTEPSNMEVETLPLEPIEHNEAKIENHRPLPPDFVSGDFPNNRVIFSRVSFDEAENKTLREVKTQKREILTEPSNMEVETLPFEPITHDEAKIENHHTLPPDFASRYLPNNHVIFSRVSFDEAENQTPLDVSQRGFSDVYVIPPSSHAYIPSAAVQSDIFYSSIGDHPNRDVLVTSSHHRDIELNSLGVSDRPLPEQDRLMASIFTSMTLQDINSDKVSCGLQQQSSAMSWLGASVRTEDSISDSYINTFHAMKSNESIKSSSASEVATETANRLQATEDNVGSVDSFLPVLDGMSFGDFSQNVGSLGHISDKYSTRMIDSSNRDTKLYKRIQDQSDFATCEDDTEDVLIRESIFNFDL